MKSARLICVTAVAVLFLLNMSVPVPSQEISATTPKHHHYKLIDIGTFGGPSSYFDDLHLTDNFSFNTALYNFSQVRNGKGILVGFADTPTPDPNSANPILCYVSVRDCFVTHAYEWRNGVKADLGVLPGGASRAA